MTPLTKAVLAAVQAEPGEWSVKTLAKDLGTRPGNIQRCLDEIREHGHDVVLSDDVKARPDSDGIKPIRSKLASEVVRLVIQNPGKWTIPEMASKVGCSINHIRHINRGTRAVGIELVYDDERLRGRYKLINMVRMLLDAGLTPRQAREALLFIRTRRVAEEIMAEALRPMQRAAK